MDNKPYALSRGAITVTFDLGPQMFRIFRGNERTPLDLPAGCIYGAHATSYVLDIPPRSTVVSVHFKPGGAFPFLGVSAAELENLCIGAEAVWGRDAAELHQRLAEATSVGARFRLLESFLLHQARFDVDRNPGVATALDAFRQVPQVRVSDVCELTGLSPERLIASFRAEVGLSPKFIRVFAGSRQR